MAGPAPKTVTEALTMDIAKQRRCAKGSKSASSASSASASAISVNATTGKVEFAAPDSQLAEQIKKLQEEQRAMATRRKQITQELRNAAKRTTRLRVKARLLIDDDLLSVLMMRKETREARAANESKESRKQQTDDAADESCIIRTAQDLTAQLVASEDACAPSGHSGQESDDNIDG